MLPIFLFYLTVVKSMKQPFFFAFILLVLAACAPVDSNHYFNKNKATHYWAGTSNQHQYQLFVDSTFSYRYSGRIIIDIHDTITVNGFKKGSLYPTFHKDTNYSEIHMFFLSSMHFKSDTLGLEINFKSDSSLLKNSYFKEDFEMIPLQMQKRQ
jgi:hypothetical protein